MPSKRYNYKQVQMRFDNIGLCCFGSCLSLLSSTLTHVHTLNTAQALQYKYKYADESKYIQTCLEFAQFSAHSLYLVEMNRAGYPIWFGTFKMCGHRGQSCKMSQIWQIYLCKKLTFCNSDRGIANLWIKLENKSATGNISFLLLLNIAIIKIHFQVICAPCHNLYEWCACYLQQRHRQSKRTKFISHRSGFYSHRHASIIPLRPSRAPRDPRPCPPSVDKHTGLCAGNVCPL